MSSMRGSAGFPCGRSARYTKPLVSAHSASTKRGSVTNGVVIGRFSGPTHLGRGGMKVGKDAPSVGKNGCSQPLPPRRDAGFVQAAFQPGRCERPKRLFAGGGAEARKDA